MARKATKIKPADIPLKTLLAEWHEVKHAAAALVEKERVLRSEIFGKAFPTPEEGSKYNKLDLEDGWMLQGDYKINRRIDEAALGEVQKQMDPIMFNRAFRFKPELSKSGFKDLADDQKAIAAQAIIASPGTPGLEIVQKKK